MKLSNETLTILKNFSTINSGIYFNAGKTLSTVSPTKTVLARAELKDEFPDSFGIYDLNNFLSVLSLGKDAAELEFDNAHVIVKALGGRSKIKYRVTDKAMIVTPPDKGINLVSVDVSFTLTAEDYDWITKTANVLQSPHIAFESDGKQFKIASFDIANDSAHVNSIELEVPVSESFRYVFKTENLKMIPGTYKVEISAKGIGHFVNEKDSVQYWIAMEK
jgi:hypothetical protein